MAGKPHGNRAMTALERQRKWRAKVRRRKLWGRRDPGAVRPSPRREDLDFWPTPPDLAAALTQIVLPSLPEGKLWECAAGDGMLADAVRRGGYQVIASDIDPQRRDIARLDFLNDPPPAASHGAILVTNPPFARSGLLEPFIARMLALLDSRHLTAAVLLQRADSAGADGRAAVFNRAVAEWTCCWRPVWIPGSSGGGRWWFSWFVWLAGRSGPPVNTRIIRADLREITGTTFATTGGAPDR
jgi:hypothetical protein